MKVKRYIVNALPEALPMIRSELGIDAVILNTKEIRTGGFLGMFAKKKLEVIAAVESGAAAPKPAPAPRQQAAPRPAAPPVQVPPAAAVPQQQAIRREAYGAATAVLSPPMDDDTPQAVPSQGAAAYNASARMTQASNLAAMQNESNRKMAEADLLDEIRDMKQWIMKMSKQQQLSRMPAAIQALHVRMIDQEVNNELIEKLITSIHEAFDGQDTEKLSQEAVWKEAKKIIFEWMNGKQAEGISPHTRVVHFVGPTGVGKTTSIAKLAAEQTLKGGRKVGFITSDTYRIAAVDQLRTYANILNVPLEVVFSPAEVSRAFKQLEDRELIFMDTAGRNFRNELYVSEVNSLLQSNDRSETYLVLSLTSKFKDMSIVAGHFAKYGIEKVLYTKQDETSAYGAILNLVFQYGLRPAYIAYGQTVPDDITSFRTDVYVEQLLGAYEQ
ncbi:flagellar biosynthesis protein FlhF [Paenibacillus phyllosphaerae]|uniref:Flagellar biosynthesis protein FlhF n=1 Tax=Paenibacillus phyllosphaerae TaxID=274593 RepID=A0A7W5FLX0_9BACL|nr:flagellar biosynthesis protein FlhF [Paenibacillus phyllosphaerae]MBB3109409.1 flagellar biosynthesis protein FlhF [Paenibacillus phyllosphaerae]